MRTTNFSPGITAPRRLLHSLVVLAAISGCVSLTAAGERALVINEIMFNPPGDQDKLQFIELHNPRDIELDLAGWTFSKGIKFAFPQGTKMEPQSYLVICSDTGAFKAHYGENIPAVGPFAGKLSHKSDWLEISNPAGQVVDSVKYSDSAPWPHGPDGYSSSLERICPSADSDQPENWAASEVPSAKRAAGTPGRQNDSFFANLPPVISAVEFTPRSPAPQQQVSVSATVADSDGVQGVVLLYRVAATGQESEERSIPMVRRSGDSKNGVYHAAIDGQPEGRLIRFRVKALDTAKAERWQPSLNEPRPTYSCFTVPASARATIPIGVVLNVGQRSTGPRHYERTPSRRTKTAPARGNGAFLYVPPDGGQPETFDHVQVVGRHGGYKVHFNKDQPFKGMTSINLISEGPMRWILAEPLSYYLFRMAGVPTPLTEHVRLIMDGRPMGFHLLVEQPNESFLARNGRDDSGNLYKLIWYGQGIIGQHEKKTNPSTGHADLIQLIEGLQRRSGADQWAFIQQHVNVTNFINYFAVNMCVQNWDGFHNNYFLYHDLKNTGKWEIIPWDEDKTWGDYDGASSRYNWYGMPLTMGMNGDGPSRDLRSRFGGGGPWGGSSWWRPPGYVSGPLLANPEFRKLFLGRLREICLTVFTEESFVPIINTMEQRLEPEVHLAAQAAGEDPRTVLREFSGYMQSFRNQVQNRRKFILNELGSARR